MQSIIIDLGSIDLSDDERAAIGAAIGRSDGRLPSADECREYVVQHGIAGINAAMGAES